MKTCNMCKRTLELTQFSKGHGKCKACRSALKRETYANNPEMREAQNVYRREYGRTHRAQETAYMRQYRARKRAA